jgi:hypothetical protein
MNLLNKPADTNYTLMVNKVQNGYILTLLNEDGETVRTLIASRYSLRDYSEYSFCSAVEAMWEYADSLVAPAAVNTPTLDPTMEVLIKEHKESEL